MASKLLSLYGRFLRRRSGHWRQYIGDLTHNGSSNFSFVDGHAKWYDMAPVVDSFYTYGYRYQYLYPPQMPGSDPSGSAWWCGSTWWYPDTPWEGPYQGYFGHDIWL